MWEITCMFIYVPELWNDHPHSMVAALLTTTTTRITTVLRSSTVHARTIPVWPVPLIRPSSTTTPPTPAPKRDTIGQATLDIHCICRVHAGVYEVKLSYHRLRLYWVDFVCNCSLQGGKFIPDSNSMLLVFRVDAFDVQCSTFIGRKGC